MELQGRYEDIRKQGLGLVAISYDPPETLKKFADSRTVTFPLISDSGSTIIRRFGLFNEQQEPGTRTYGVPHPGTFIVNRKGVVTARFFEDAYQERYTAAAILTAQGANPRGTAVTAQTEHLTMSASISNVEVAPGERISISIDVTPRPTIHVYEIYHFKPLDERVDVYSKPFRVIRDVTILATPEVQKSLAALSEVTITGALEYQACDDKVCFNPARVPFRFTIATKSLDRRPPG